MSIAARLTTLAAIHRPHRCEDGRVVCPAHEPMCEWPCFVSVVSLALTDLVAAAEAAEDAMSAMHSHCDDEGQCVDIRHSQARHSLRAALTALNKALQ